MLNWTFLFLLVALIAGVLGFGGIAGTAATGIGRTTPNLRIRPACSYAYRDSGGGCEGAPVTSADGGGSGGSSGSSGAKCLTSLMPNQNSGPMGSGEVCFDVEAPIAGWQASSVMGRTIEVNGTRVTAGMTPLPAAVDDHYVFVFGAGGETFASWSYWR